MAARQTIKTRMVDLSILIHVRRNDIRYELLLDATRIQGGLGDTRAILSDNGSPYGSRPGKTLRLLLWWIRLGIRIERIVPGHPEQNGAHERMHRTLKAETTRPPDHSMERQQKRFDEFRHMYNHERPHETLGQKRPATINRPSLRSYPETLPPIVCAGHLQIRKVGQNGMNESATCDRARHTES